MFNVLQWNYCRLRANQEELKVLVRNSRANIICLQETLLGDREFNFGLDYSVYRSLGQPVGQASGGTAVIVHRSLQHSVVDLDTDLQATAVTFTSNSRVTVCSLYLEPHLEQRRPPLSLADLQHLVNQLPAPFIILGDFNAKNPMWESTCRDRWGQIVEDLVDANSISLLNDGSFTRFDIHHGTHSAIDVTLCSSSIYLDYTWSRDMDLHGSDHYPIFIKHVQSTPSESFPKWKLEEADWVKFRELLETLDLDLGLGSHIEAYDHLVDSLLDAADICIPKTKGKPKRPTVPWWTKECGTLRKVTRSCYRRYLGRRSENNKVALQRARAKQRRFYKQVRRESWIKYVNGINSRTPIKTVWTKVKKLSGKFIPSPPPSIKLPDGVSTDPVVVADTLGEHFSKVSSRNNYPVEFSSVSEPDLNFDSDNSEDYNAPFSLKELRSALSLTRATAPGEDTIHYTMLKHLPDKVLRMFLYVFNRVWETSVLPESWKVSTIVPILKPGKEAGVAASYRPIALTSCLCKLFEKMVNTRFVWLLETKGLISDNQFGFRKNRSTLDPLMVLSRDIEKSFALGKQVIGVFFDLEKAYDTTWRYGILRQLGQWGIRGFLPKFLNSFLSDRFLKVRVGATYSKPFVQEEGVPQGSVLSVTLFIVAVNSLISSMPADVRGSLFVDDFSVYCSGHTASAVCSRVQHAIDAAAKWADNHGFRFSTSKTKAIRFTRRRKQEQVPTLTLKGSIISYEERVKFLGVIFDSKLTFGPHIDDLVSKTKKSLNILKVVSSFNWGADRTSLLRLYSALCRSKMDYACQIYSAACRTHLKKLDVVHNQGLRLCTGAYITSPIESLLVDSGEMPLELRREELSLRYISRIRSSPSNPNYVYFSDYTPAHARVDYRQTHPKPLEVRMKDACNDLEIPDINISEVRFSETPPWSHPSPSSCEEVGSKKTHLPEDLRAKFLSHVSERHSGSVHLYTDGSKSTEGVGLAVVDPACITTCKLDPSCSVFTAELSAVEIALRIINKYDANDFTIFTDSQSVISAVKQYSPFHPLVRSIQDWLRSLHSRRKNVSLCWVPAHVGIQQNETADQVAKRTASSDQATRLTVPHVDLKATFRSYVLWKWQGMWASLVTNTKLKSIRQTIAHWASSFPPDVGLSKVLTRLRIGHTRLTQGYLRQSGPDREVPRCPHCSATLTVHHFMVDCPHHEQARLNHGYQGCTLAQIIGEDCDFIKLMSFLKAINVFYEI